MGFLNKNPKNIGIHELFCCDNCVGKGEGVDIYINMMCVLRMGELGVKNVVVGLQYDHFWERRENFWEVLGGRNSSVSVIILKRDNYLAYLSASAGKKVKESKFIKRVLIENMPRKVRRFQRKYREMYCLLKKRGVKVLLLTYEELIENFEQKMKIVSDFMEGEGEKNNRWYGGFVSKHKKLEGRIENGKEVREFLEKNHPEYLCMLTEDCIYPDGFDCENLEGTYESFSFVPKGRKKHFLK